MKMRGLKDQPLIFMLLLMSSWMIQKTHSNADCPEQCVCMWKSGKETTECINRYVCTNIFFCQHLMRAYSTHVMNSEALFIFLDGLVTIRKWPIILLLNHLLHMPYIRLYMKTVYYIGTDLGIILFLVL